MTYSYYPTPEGTWEGNGVGMHVRVWQGRVPRHDKETVPSEGMGVIGRETVSWPQLHKAQFVCPKWETQIVWLVDVDDLITAPTKVWMWISLFSFTIWDDFVWAETYFECDTVNIMRMLIFYHLYVYITLSMLRNPEHEEHLPPLHGLLFLSIYGVLIAIYLSS